MENIIEIKTVNIPARDQHEGFYSTNIKLKWICPKCGQKRGDVFKTISFDGSMRLACDGWLNPCGHVDYYSDVRKEAAENPC